MFLFTLVLAVICGWLRGGRLFRLSRLPLRWVLVLPVPFIIRSLLLNARVGDAGFLEAWAPWLQSVAYGLLVLLAVVNRHLPGSSYLLAGTGANALVIVANGGRMPVSEAAIHIAARDAERGVALNTLLAEQSLTHELLTPDTRLPWLADIIPLPHPFPFPSVASPGDVLIALGLFWFIVSSMGTRRDREAGDAASAA